MTGAWWAAPVLVVAGLAPAVVDRRRRRMVRARIVPGAHGRGAAGVRLVRGAPPGPAGVMGAVGAAGRWVRRRLPPSLVGDATAGAADVAIGATVLAALALLVVAPPAAPALVVAVPAAGVLRRRARRRHARMLLLVELPDVVDLFRVAARAGATPVMACLAVARHAEGALAHACARTMEAVAAGLPFVVALDRVRVLGEPVLPLVDALAAAERDGAPLLAALDRVAADGRLERRRAAEEAARAVPVRLLFPLVLCTLPAFGLLTVAPLTVRSLHDLLP